MESGLFLLTSTYLKILAVLIKRYHIIRIDGMCLLTGFLHLRVLGAFVGTELGFSLTSGGGRLFPRLFLLKS